MKSRTTYCILYFLFFICLLFHYPLALADDTCAFMVTADDVPPNIVFLLDNGAAMEEIVRHNSYDKSQNFTPTVLDQYDLVEFGVLKGNGFFKENGYAVIRKDIENNGIEKYFLVAIPDNQDVADYTFKLTADGDGLSPIWTINNRTITLPAHPGNHEFEGVIDNATYFRYSSNYLNWIYFGDYSDNGGDLPSITRFYQAKKALMTVGKLIANQAKIAIYNFTATTSGASNVQPLGMVALEPLASQSIGNSLDPNYINNINNMGTVIYSPLAEGLATVGGFFGNPSSHIVESYCHENFIIVLSPGKSSEDLSVAAKSSPSSLSDFDNDDGAEGIVEGYVKENENIHMIPIGQNGSTYLDDVAYYLYNNDIVDYRDGFQNIRTYTIGFMGDFLSNLFLINTSNNGNGNTNLYDTDHEEYGKYHFETHDPNNLADTIFSAIIDIISQTSSFTAPVVPVTRTTSGNRIYMAFFKPNEGIFWEGNVVKFGIADDNTIVDKYGDPATWPNGAIREDAQPYWRIKDWADPNKSNYIHNSSRNIFTYLGYNTNLADTSDLSNQFSTNNDTYITAEILRWPTHSVAEIINFVRGADVLDEDEDGDTTENRAIITGDILHSEPLVVRYNYPDYTSKTYVYFGTNDGMLHAVKDVEDPNVDVDGDETNYGNEEWAFIPPDQLQRLKDMVEGNGHQYYIDSSAKAYFKDFNNNGMLDDVNNDGIMDSNDDQIILICGERRGGSSYFALDVTIPDKPKYMWRIGSGNENTIIKYDGLIPTFSVSNWVGNLTTEMYNNYMSGDITTAPFVWGQIVSSITTGPQEGILELENIRRHTGGFFQNDENLTLWDGVNRTWSDAAMVMDNELVPDVIIPELGESWSEPQFGLVKTTETDTDGTAVFFIGGGYSESNSSGKAVLAVNVFTGEIVRKFTEVVSIPTNDTTITTDLEHTTDTNMYYSFPSTVKVIDEDGNGFVDKLYVGDLGGQMWRIGQFETDANGNSLAFPKSNENINSWTAQILFKAPTYVVDTVTHTRKFYYPPSVTLEVGYDLIVTGTGDRPGSCDLTSQDRIYVIKDDHSSNAILETDLVDVTDPAAPKPDLENNIDMGWYIQLSPGEKSLAENTVFYRTIYLTTFTPNNDPCLPGGMGKIYALNYKTGAAVIDFDGGGTLYRSTEIGGGIPSKVVTVMTDTGGTKLFISVGSTNPDLLSESFEAGVVAVDPLVPPIDFHYLWWRELLDME